MQIEFQAKDIQMILGIAKYRYEYLKAKIRVVQSDVEKGEGRGKVNRYSFKNLMEFAIIYTANELGMSPDKIKGLMYRIGEFDSRDKIGIYDPSISDLDFSIHVIFDSGDWRIHPSGKSVNADNQAIEDIAYRNSVAKSLTAYPALLSGFKKRGKGFDDAMKEWDEKRRKEVRIAEKQEDGDGHVSINIGRIKKRIFNNIG